MLGNPKFILHLLLGGVVTSRYWWPKILHYLTGIPSRELTNISHPGKKNHLQQCLGMGYLSSQEGIKPNQRQKLWAGFRISEAMNIFENTWLDSMDTRAKTKHDIPNLPTQSSRELSSTLFKWHSFAQDLGTASVNLKRYQPGVPTARMYQILIHPAPNSTA